MQGSGCPYWRCKAPQAGPSGLGSAEQPGRESQQVGATSCQIYQPSVGCCCRMSLQPVSNKAIEDFRIPSQHLYVDG